MIDNNGMIVFVTIGVPFSCVPIMQKVMLYVDPDTDTPVSVAKKLRKEVAEIIENHGWVTGTRFKPSELYYEIFASENDVEPYCGSPNSPRGRELGKQVV